LPAHEVHTRKAIPRDQSARRRKVGETICSQAGKIARCGLKPFVPSWLDECGLTPVQFRVLSHLWRRADRLNGRCYPGAKSIAKICRINRDTVWASLNHLETLGLLRREENAGSSNSYYVFPPSGVWEAHELEKAGMLNEAPDSRSNIIETMITNEELHRMEAECVAKGITISGYAFSQTQTQGRSRPVTPSQIYAHFKALTGEDRLVYLAANREVIWEQHTAQQNA
jgi:hypothetical protein